MPHVLTIGAGIVGACTARALQLDGADVTLIDRDLPGMGCSYGNAGVISTLVSSVQPPGPRMLRQVGRLLFSSRSPARIPLMRLPELTPWLVSCAAGCTGRNQLATARAMASLLAGSTSSYDTLVKGTPADAFIRRGGSMGLFRTEEIFEHDRWRRDLSAEMGAEQVELERHEIRQMEPSLTDRVARAVLFPSAYSTPDPAGLTRAIVDMVVRDGGEFQQAEVTRLHHADGRLRSVETAKGTKPVDRVVVAAGAFSGRLARMLGIRTRLNTERGFHIELTDFGTGLNRPGMHYEHAYGVNPMKGGLRFAGMVEFGGLGRARDLAPCDLLWKNGKTLLRETEAVDQPQMRKWSGFRPTMPDFRPVLGPAPGLRNCWFAFGHQHLGLSLAARTGLLVADMVAGRDPGVDLSPFRSDRFRFSV